MPGPAHDLMKQFWAVQDSHDYTRLNDFFGADSELHDPIYGSFVGKEAIVAFLAKATHEMAALNMTFRLVELQGEDNVAWGRWEAVTPAKITEGVGVYRVERGVIRYYRDYYPY